MDYPLISEYREAILSAEDNFNELALLRPVLDGHGDPVMSSGNFAVVFKMKDENDGKLYAIKCFIKDQEGRDESYRKIADELEVVSSSYVLPLRYLENELFVDSPQCDREEFSVVVMEWVEGETLDTYLKRHLNDKYELEMLSYRFNRMSAWLLAQPFAHGDLKPDNILVRRDGSLVLVDYDGMFVPSMKGEKARELGSPDYRHPLRTDADFNEHIDDFSIAVIALSLKAIALKPELKFLTSASDTLLFKESDFLAPAKSIVFQQLLTLVEDSALMTLYGVFMIAHSKKHLDPLAFRLFSTEKPKVNKAYYLNYIKQQFQRVVKLDKFSFFAIVNVLISSQNKVIGSGKVRRVWLAYPDESEVRCDVKRNQLVGGYCLDKSGIWQSISSQGSSNDLDDVVLFAYQLFKQLNVLEDFMRKGEEAINHMNRMRLLSEG